MKHNARWNACLLVLACLLACALASCANASSNPPSGSQDNPANAHVSSEATGSAAESGATSGEQPASAQAESADSADTGTPSTMNEPNPVSAATTTELGASPAWVSSLPEAAKADQLFIVAGYGPTTAWASMHEKDADGNWQMVMTTPAFIGRQGLGKTVEGDALTPIGTFTFDRAFGIAPDPGCQMTYTQVTDNLYWSGDHREGMRYNQMVDINELPGLDTASSEHLIDYTREYQYCLNISFNADCIPGNGSAIFLHCLGASHPFTGGCVAIPEEQMKVVMQHVEPGCTVIIDTMENLGATM